MSESAVAVFQPFASLAQALDGPRSSFFGVGSDGRNKREESYYRSVDRYVSFDVSNNQVLCTIAASGLLGNACLLKGVVPSRGVSDTLPGVFADKDLIGGGPWPFRLRLGEAAPVSLHEIPGSTVELLGALFPLFTYRQGPLRVRLLAFAPAADSPAALPPRAVIGVLQLDNQSDEFVEGALEAPSAVPDLTQVQGGANARARHQAVICLDDAKWRPEWPQVSFRLEPGRSAVLCFAFLLGESAKELQDTGCSLRERTALDWLNQTWQRHADRLGRLSIPGDPYYAEGFVRFRELCRQSVLRLSDGRFGGGFWGSDFIGVSAWASPKIWNKDNFHAMLPMAMLEPALCADAILFFLRWGAPHAPFGGARKRFPHARRVTHSLGNALSPLVLAGAYYQMTGDRAFFLHHPEVLHLGRGLLDDIVQSRQGKPFLFPSMYISDGESRGDYHTGSNLLVWYSFYHMARIAGEVYGRADLAAQWAEVASKVKEAVFTHLIGHSSLGPRFFEGANEDGTFVACHDGEETDVALMPFYGSCEADEPALISHSKLGLSPENPLYAPGVDGIWWGDTTRTGATFPAWMTALAGAAAEDELRLRLEYIRRLTDVDGSIWWWPYKYPETDPAKARRRDPYFVFESAGEKQEVGVGKCGWAAGVYLCLFINNVLGIRTDVPARQVSLRPFCPWAEFAWENCHLGAALFDFAYERRDGRIVGRITNRNDSTYQGLIELTLPDGARAGRCKRNGAAAHGVVSAQRYRRPSLRLAHPIPAGQTLEFEVEYARG